MMAGEKKQRRINRIDGRTVLFLTLCACLVTFLNAVGERLLRPEKSDYGLHNNQYRAVASVYGSLPALLGVVKAVYWRSNFVGRVVEAAGPGAGGGYSDVPGREKRL